jgi:hypothetical protein
VVQGAARRGPTFMATLVVAMGLSVALVAVGPRAARGAACCMSATAHGVGRLLNWEDAAVGLTTSMAFRLGAWSPDAEWESWGDDFAEQEWRTELWGLVGLSRRASLWLRVPWMVTHRRAGELDELGHGLADLSLGARYELLAIGEILQLPALALSAGVTVPTGRDTEGAAEVLGSDITGRGAWVFSFGLSVEKTKLPWFVRGDAGVTVPLPAERESLGRTQRYGPGVQLAFSAGWEVAMGLVLSGIARFDWEGPIRLDGDAIDNSERYALGLGAALSWRWDPHWTLQLGADSHVFTSHLGDNQPGQVTTTLGVRYGFF